MSQRQRKRRHPKRDRTPVRKSAPQHPFDGVLRVLGIKPERRPIHPNKPAVPDQALRYGTSLQ